MSKVKVMCEVVSDENVNFVWEIATDISDEKLEISRSYSRVVCDQRIFSCKPDS